jgi:hypothetical protein
MLRFCLRPLIIMVTVGLASAVQLCAREEPKLSVEQMKEFLLTAKVIASRHTKKGITSPWQLTLTDGKITHDAVFQSIDETKDGWKSSDGRVETYFRDCWKYDIAAYELANLLGLGDMMPVTVQRKWNGQNGAISWWLPVKMDEATRRTKNIEPPDVSAFSRQMYKKRIFAELVFDTDQNLTNVLISEDWRLWMIDFTRAFRLHKDLFERTHITDSLCERHLLERLRKLDRDELTEKTKGYLGKPEIDGVMARRDKIVAIYEDLIAKKGELAVLYDDPAAK